MAGPVEGRRLQSGTREILYLAGSSLSTDGGVEIEERNLDFCAAFCGTVPGVISNLRLTRVSCPSSRPLLEACLFSSVTKSSFLFN